MTLFKGDRRMPVFRDSEPEDDRIDAFARAAFHERLAEALRKVLARALASEHNHIFQVERGLRGCPVCERINPEHMTREYVLDARRRAAREELERMLRE